MEVTKMMQKRGQLGINALPAVGIAFVVTGIVLGFGAYILDQVQGTMTTNTTAWNSTRDAELGIGKLASWQPIIAVVVAAAIIIGLILIFKKND